MVMSSPFVITLSDADRAELTARAQAAKIPYRDVLRAKIILACAADLNICDDTVRKWRKRFAGQGLAGLKDLPRPGRSATFTPVQKVALLGTMCAEGDQQVALPVPESPIKHKGGLTLDELADHQLQPEIIT
jgi:transposase